MNMDTVPARSGYVAVVSAAEKEMTPIEKLAYVMARDGKKGVVYLLIPAGLKHSQEYESRIPQAADEADATASEKKHAKGKVKDGVIEWFKEE